MALIPCSECGHQISSAAKSCPKCGNPVHTEKVTNGSGKVEIDTIHALMIVLIPIIGLLMGIALLTNPDKKQTAQVSILLSAVMMFVSWLLLMFIL